MKTIDRLLSIIFWASIAMLAPAYFLGWTDILLASIILILGVTAVSIAIMRKP